MNIDINKNIDAYREDVCKGLTLRQCVCSVLTLAAGGGAYILSDAVAGLGQMVSVYVTLAASAPFAVLGFFNLHGMSVTEYLKKRWDTKRMAVLTYESEESVFLPTAGRAPARTGRLREKIRRLCVSQPLFESSASLSEEEVERWLME